MRSHLVSNWAGIWKIQNCNGNAMKSTKCKKHLQFCFWILSPVKYPLCDDLILNASTEKKKNRENSWYEYASALCSKIVCRQWKICISSLYLDRRTRMASVILIKIPQIPLLFIEGENGLHRQPKGISCSWHQTTNFVFPKFFHEFFIVSAVEREKKLFVGPMTNNEKNLFWLNKKFVFFFFSGSNLEKFMEKIGKIKLVVS